MDQRSTVYCSVYLLIWASTAAIAFLSGDRLFGAGIGYVFLIALYVVPILAVLNEDVSASVMAGYLVMTPLLALLIVVDPVEMGLFGHDPYVYTVPALEFFRTRPSMAAFINEGGEWPAFYALFVLVEQITDVPMRSVAKYIPLLSSSVPFIYFVAVLRYTDRRIAFLSAMALASVRTLLLFESKFISETIAVVLFFVLIVVLRFSDAGWPTNLATIVAMLALVFSHPVVSYVVVLFLGCWALISRISRNALVPDRFVSQRRSFSDIRSRQALIVGIGITSMFVYTAYVFSTSLIGIAYSALVLGQTTPAPISESSTGAGIITIRQLVSRGALVVLGVLATISGIGLLSRYRAEPWEAGWTVFAGIVSVLYVGTIVGGRVIHLDPIRLLLFLVAALVPPALTVIVRSKRPKFVTCWPRYPIAAVIVCVFIVTQIAAVPPHVLYSDPSNTTLEEGHYTPTQFAASSWAGTHADAAVVGYEQGLWIAGGAGFRDVSRGGDECDSTLRVWRIETEREPSAEESMIYDGGDVAFTTCSSV